MSARTLLAALRDRGIRLVAAGDRLRYAPVDLLTAEDLAALKRHKGALLNLLRVEQGSSNALSPVQPIRVGDRVQTRNGEGQAWQVFARRIAVVLDAAPPRVAYYPAESVGRCGSRMGSPSVPSASGMASA